MITLTTEKKYIFALGLVILLGFAIRIAGLGWGLPTRTRTLTTYHADEAINLYCLEKMNPRKLDFYPGVALGWGSFQIYLQGGLSYALARLGWIKLGDRKFLLSHPAETDKLYITGRVISVIFGTLSIFVMFLIGQKIYGVKGGLVSALLLAVTPLPVMTSFFAKPDSIMPFWGLLAIFFSLHLLEKEEVKYYYLAGIMVGLSGVSKYSGFSYFAVILLAHFMLVVRKKNVFMNADKVLYSGLLALFTFVLFNPYCVIRFSDFYTWFTDAMNYGKMSGNIFLGYREYLSGIIPSALRWPVYALSLLGLFLLVKEAKEEEKILALFILIYVFRFGAARPQTISYCLPMIPALLLFSTKAIMKISSNRPAKIACILAVGYTLIYTVSYKRLYCGQDVREEASDWIGQNIPVDAVIGISRNDYWTPPVLKQAAPPYKIIEGRPPQMPFLDSINMLPVIARKIDYLVLTEIEYSRVYYYYARQGERLKKMLRDDFVEIALIEKPLVIFGVKYRTSPLATSYFGIVNPKIHIFKKKVFPNKKK